MSSLVVATQVILPLLILMSFGVLLRKTKVLEETTYKKINVLIFKALLPVLLFNNVYKSDFYEAFDGKLILFALISVIVVYLLLMLFVPMVIKDNRTRGAFIQGVFRSNFAIFGIPLTLSIAGEAAAAKVAVMVAFTVPLYNVLAVITLEMFRHGKPEAKKILKGIVTNPLIISSVLGILASIIRLRLPAVLETAVGDVAKITTPLALIVLGASLDFALLKANSLRVILASVGRLILEPLVCMTVAVMVGFRGVDLAVLLALFASPTAVSSFPMAQQMGSDDALAGQIIAVTTAFCIFTVFLFVFGLDMLGVL